MILYYYMNNLVILIIISIASLVLGCIKYGSLSESYKGASWQLKVMEIWNDFINYLITGLVGYYFILVRLPSLLSGGALNTGDFGIFTIFALGSFGHLCVMSKNITDGVEAILKRVLER